jgi:hypothetical protein
LFRIYATVAAGLCLAVTAVSASAGELSYESRGYGGPLYVGPNFKEGGQYTPPTYGPKSSSQERSTPARERSVSKHRKAAATREADTEKEKAAPAAKTATTGKAAESENSTISAAALQTGHTDAEASHKGEASATPTTCKRYIAAAGQTVTVPCD